MRCIYVFMYMVLVFMQWGGIAIGQESAQSVEAVAPAAEACEGILCSVMQKFPEINAWLLAVFIFLSVMLRAVADLLGFVGKQLKKDGANKWAEKLGSWSLWAAQLVASLNGGTPKVVLEKKVADVTGKSDKS